MKIKAFKFKYELLLCIFLLILFRANWFIELVLFQVIGIDYDSITANITVIILHAVIFTVVIGIGLHDQKKSLTDVCYNKKVSPAVWCAALLCSIGFVMLHFYLNNLFYLVFKNWLVFPDVDELGNFNIIFVIINSALIPAIAEEILFKGVIFSGLEKKYSRWIAVMIASLLFAAAHLNLVRMVPLFLFSFCTFWLYLRTGSLLLPILIHFINNLFATVLISEPFYSPETFLASQIIFWAGFYFLQRLTSQKQIPGDKR